MADMMTFPDTVEEFMEQYKITDTDHVYTNGADMVPIFRMKQWFEHQARTQMSSTNCISRQAAIDVIRKWKIYETTEGLADRINKLPSAEPEIIRCRECKNHGKAIAWCQYSPDDAFCSYAERRTDE